MASGPIQIEIDQKAIARAKARLSQFKDEPLRRRLQVGTLAAANLLRKPMAAAANYKTGRLRKSVRARQLRSTFGGQTVGKLTGALVGPTAPHAHLVVTGHRIVTRSGRDTGARSKAFPFPAQTYERHAREALDIVNRELFKE